MSRPVLLAEDNADDVFLVRRALRDANAMNPLHVVSNGDDAIHYLAGTGVYADREQYPLPAMVLLDLEMPGKDGLDVLRWMHDHPEIPKSIPVIVLSSRVMPEQAQQAHALDITACLVKPFSYDELRERVRILKDYWLEPDSAR